MRWSQKDTGIKGFLSNGMAKLAGSCNCCTTTRKWGINIKSIIESEEIKARVPKPSSRMKTGQK